MQELCSFMNYKKKKNISNGICWGLWNSSSNSLCPKDCERLCAGRCVVGQDQGECVLWGQHVDLCLARHSNGWPSGNVSELLGVEGPPSCTLIRGRDHCDLCTKRREQPRIFCRDNFWVVDSGAQSLQTLVYIVVRVSQASFSPPYKRASIKEVSLYLLRVTNFFF